MTESFYIDDLAEPDLTEMQQGAIAYGESQAVGLTPQSILAQAREEVGLDDFGPEDFHERLALLCDEWRSDTGLLNIGRLSLRNKLLQHARSRLLIQDVLTRHPEIHAIEIAEPIIVVGLPRSGTTHLLNLMAADSRLRSLPLWESYEPVPLPGEVPNEKGIDPRYQRCADQWDSMQAMSPLLASMHPMNPDHIHEELELMGPDFASYNYEWLCVSPRWRDHYYATDQTPHYEYMKTVLKILTWQDGDTTGKNTRWVLKCPQHLEQLPALQSVFPDATIAVTHRDPVSVVQSAVTMLGYGQRISRKKVDLGGLIDYWSDRIVHLLQACVRDRASLPADKSIDVPFDEFMADDLAMVEKIYAKAGLETNEAARSELRAYLDEHPRGKHGQVKYNLRKHFNVEPADLRQRFQFYFDRFDVKIEVK